MQLSDFDFSSGAPVLKAWPDGAPIVRPGDPVRIIFTDASITYPPDAATKRGASVIRSANQITIEGTARNVERDGWFDVMQGDGGGIGFSASDPTIRITILTEGVQ